MIPLEEFTIAAQSIFIEEVNQILAFTTLCTITRYQNISLRHNLSQDFTHFRISCSYYGSDIAVLITHALFAPGGYLLTYQFVQRSAINQTILELAAGRVGCLNQDK